MSAQLTPSKRHHDQSPSETTGRKKSHKSSAKDSDGSASRGSLAHNLIRLLYPASRINEVIEILSQISDETGTKVIVEEIAPECDERVIIITGVDKESEVGREQVIMDAEDMEIVGSEQVKMDAKDMETLESDDVPEKNEETDQDKQPVPVDDSQSEKEKETNPVQKALLVLFDKLLNGFSEANEGDEESNKASSFVVRVLVHSSQVGGLLGKAGSVIKQMSSESGAQIRILPKDKLPLCSSSSDEVVQITGELDAVRKALHSVSKQLLENHANEQDPVSANKVGHSSGHPPARHDRFPSSNRNFRGRGAPFSSGFQDGDDSIPGRGNFPSDVLSFRLLCNDEKVGGVIGKGGSIVKSLQNETGCEIKVLDAVPDSDERIIVISGPAYPDDGISAPQDALLRVQSRIFRAAPESKEKPLTAKILVFSYQIGCLLGKGGSVIAEMRKSTGAYIRILGKDQNPKCASENEEVVQVNGEFEVVQEALLQITTNLRNHFLRDAFPMGRPLNPSFHDHMHPFPPYMGRREFSPSRTFPSRGPAFNKFDGPGGLPHGGGFPSHDDHPPFAHDFIGPGIISERMSSAIPQWGPQGSTGGAGPMGFPDYPGGPHRRPGGFAGASQLAIITSTTVEVVVPSFVIPAIYGENGGCLRQIREISDAKITIADPKPGATETLITIYGSPEQTNAAQSLIQAFVISETEAP